MEVTDVEDVFFVRRVRNVRAHVEGEGFPGQLCTLWNPFYLHSRACRK